MKFRRAWLALAAAVLTSSGSIAHANSYPGSFAARQSTSTTRIEKTPITLIGCIQRESDYRRAHDIGRGGAVGSGIGSGDEFVLINAWRIRSADSPVRDDIDCSHETTAEAYELTGRGEDDLKPLVGRAVMITGILKKADVEEPVGTSGIDAPRPTGGFDPLNRDLRLFEVNVTSFQELPPAAPRAATAAPVEVPPAPAAEPPARTEEPPAPVARESAPAETPRTEARLPQTASPLPIAGLFGLLSLGGAVGLRLRRRG